MTPRRYRRGEPVTAASRPRACARAALSTGRSRDDESAARGSTRSCTVEEVAPHGRSHVAARPSGAADVSASVTSAHALAAPRRALRPAVAGALAGRVRPGPRRAGPASPARAPTTPGSTSPRPTPAPSNRSRTWSARATSRTPSASPAWSPPRRPSGSTAALRHRSAATSAARSRAAARQHAVPVLVAYNLPFRDCAQYSAGGAADTDAYLDVDPRLRRRDRQPPGRRHPRAGRPRASSRTTSTSTATPSGASPTAARRHTRGAVPRAQRRRRRAHARTTPPRSTSTAPTAPGSASATSPSACVKAGVQRARGFFLNVSNFQTTSRQLHYGTWISECIAYATNPADGGWRLGHFDYCASQYYPADPNDESTWHLTDEWYAANLARRRPDRPLRHRHQPQRAGPLGGPGDPPGGATPRCGATRPDRGLGLRPTTRTGNPLADAFLWIKTPGQSDGQCHRWTTGPVDPVRGIVDPPAGDWFPQMASSSCTTRTRRSSAEHGARRPDSTRASGRRHRPSPARTYPGSAMTTTLPTPVTAPARTYEVRTFGCQMNVHDSERLSGLLEAAGYVRAAARRAGRRRRLQHLRRPGERRQQALRQPRSPGAGQGRAAGHADRRRRLPRPEGPRRHRPQGALGRRRLRHPQHRLAAGAARAGPAQRARPRSRSSSRSRSSRRRSRPGASRPTPPGSRSASAATTPARSASCRACAARRRTAGPGEILAEVEALVAEGAIEVTLLGQNVNTYGVEFGDRGAFAKLLRACGAVEGLERVRFTSPHPAAFTDDVIEAMAATPNVMPQLHMPLQSGSDRVLKAMRRSYRAERFLGIVERVRAADARRRPVDRHHRRLPGRDRGGLPGDPRRRRGLPLRAGVHVPVLAAARARRPPPCPTRCRRPSSRSATSGWSPCRSEISWEENRRQEGRRRSRCSSPRARAARTAPPPASPAAPRTTGSCTSRCPPALPESGRPRPGDMVTVAGHLRRAAPPGRGRRPRRRSLRRPPDARGRRVGAPWQRRHGLREAAPGARSGVVPRACPPCAGPEERGGPSAGRRGRRPDRERQERARRRGRARARRRGRQRRRVPALPRHGRRHRQAHRTPSAGACRTTCSTSST